MKKEQIKLTRFMARRGPLIFLLCLGLLFAAVVVTEWYFRFARYHFEMELFHLPSRQLPSMAGGSGFTTNAIPEHRGGDLTALIGIEHAAEPYQEWRPPAVQIHDSHGFTNRKYDPEATPDAVVVGDSFMATGRMEDMFATRLAERSGLFIYNRAMIGHGPILSVERFFGDPRHQEKKPAFLVWGFAEREIGGLIFERLYYFVTQGESSAQKISNQSDASKYFQHRLIHWDSFTPAKLKKSFPATSLLAQSTQWVWNRVRYVLFGRIHPDLIPSRDLVLDERMLFYRYNIDSISVKPEDRQLPMVIQAIKALDDLCRSQGTKLIVVLIPEKEQVYRNWLPDRFNPPDHPLPPSSLGSIDTELKKEGVLVINMLPIFDEATIQGKRVYWRDDTHWNSAGIDMAAAEVWKVMQENRP